MADNDGWIVQNARRKKTTPRNKVNDEQAYINSLLAKIMRPGDKTISDYMLFYEHQIESITCIIESLNELFPSYSTNVLYFDNRCINFDRHLRDLQETKNNNGKKNKGKKVVENAISCIQWYYSNYEEAYTTLVDKLIKLDQKLQPILTNQQETISQLFTTAEVKLINQLVSTLENKHNVLYALTIIDNGTNLPLTYATTGQPIILGGLTAARGKINIICKSPYYDTSDWSIETHDSLSDYINELHYMNTAIDEDIAVREYKHLVDSKLCLYYAAPYGVNRIVHYVDLDPQLYTMINGVQYLHINTNHDQLGEVAEVKEIVNMFKQRTNKSYSLKSVDMASIKYLQKI